MGAEVYQRKHDHSGTPVVSGHKLNAELDAVAAASGAADTARRLIQREDGELRDAIVKRHTLHQEVLDLMGSGALSVAYNPDTGELTVTTG